MIVSINLSGRAGDATLKVSPNRQFAEEIGLPNLFSSLSSDKQILRIGPGKQNSLFNNLNIANKRKRIII